MPPHEPPPFVRTAPQPLTDADRAIWQWQMWSPGFGETGQQRLKGASIMVSRVGGLGSVVAYELAAAGVGRLLLAHAGDVKPSDLNRQLLMTHDWIGKPRITSVERRLKDLNPRLAVVPVAENASPANAMRLVEQVDVVVDAAPLFEERFAMNDACVRQGKPMVECAMYDLEAHVFTIVPGVTPCLRCLYPDWPATWKRQFPVFGAVSGTVGCIGAMEAIKLVAGLGEPLLGRMLSIDLGKMTFRMLKLYRDPNCPICATAAGGGSARRAALR